jgi:uncharacterized protein
MKTNQELLEYIETLIIIDTHEHLPSTEADRNRNTDILGEYLSHYFSSDLVSAGLKKEELRIIQEEDRPVMEKWRMVEPYWQASRHTGYGRALEIAIKRLYGVDRFSTETIEELNEQYVKTLEPGHFKRVLKEESKIEISLLCVETLEKKYNPMIERSIHCDRDFFHPVYIINPLVRPYSWNQIEMVERVAGIRITSFSRWLEAVDENLKTALSSGSRVLKNTLAYWRSLSYEQATRHDAEAGFNEIFKSKHQPDWEDRPLCTSKQFQDYMFHYILDFAGRNNLVFQVHTGIQEGIGNLLSNSNPEHLTPLFLQYPDVDFDLFHIGYPYQNIITALAKNFQNVFIDMCWTHIISPEASINALTEWTESVPLNKISAFGGDYMFVDGVFGHLQIARINVARALTKKIDDGLFDLDEAKVIAKMLFYDNPKRIFKL